MAEQMVVVEVEAPAGASQDERRDALRYECGEASRCVYFTTGQALWARVKNVSKTGIGLLVSQPIASGSYLYATGWQAGLSLQARVMHCTRSGEASWLIGCKFSVSLGDRELETVLKNWV